jgi:hypothetical protein
LPEPPQTITNNIINNPLPSNNNLEADSSINDGKAIKYFRLGIPKEPAIQYVKELNKLLESKKVFTDS